MSGCPTIRSCSQLSHLIFLHLWSRVDSLTIFITASMVQPNLRLAFLLSSCLYLHTVILKRSLNSFIKKLSIFNSFHCLLKAITIGISDRLLDDDSGYTTLRILIFLLCSLHLDLYLTLLFDPSIFWSWRFDFRRTWSLIFDITWCL